MGGPLCENKIWDFYIIVDGAGAFNVPTPLPSIQSWRKDAQQQLTATIRGDGGSDIDRK